MAHGGRMWSFINPQSHANELDFRQSSWRCKRIIANGKTCCISRRTWLEKRTRTVNDISYIDTHLIPDSLSSPTRDTRRNGSRLDSWSSCGTPYTWWTYSLHWSSREQQPGIACVRHTHQWWEHSHDFTFHVELYCMIRICIFERVLKLNFIIKIACLLKKTTQMKMWTSVARGTVAMCFEELIYFAGSQSHLDKSQKRNKDYSLKAPINLGHF